MRTIAAIALIFVCINMHAQRIQQSNSNNRQLTKQNSTADDINFYIYNSFVYNIASYKSLSFQLSQGFAKKITENNRFDENTIRTVASVQNTVHVSRNSYFTSSLMLGINREQKNNIHEHAINYRSLSVQGDYNIKRFAVYGRFESIQRLFSQLSLPGGSSRVSFTLNSISLGTSFRLFYLGAMDLRIGGHCTAALQPQGFNIFNSRAAFSGQFYIRLLPSILNMYDTQRASREKRRVRMSF